MDRQKKYGIVIVNYIFMSFRNQTQKKLNNQKGFTLIELLVVVAIIALLSSVALIALISARQKSRNAKRLGDMTQMNTGLEIYFAYYRGYPEDANNDGVPDGISPQYTAQTPVDPSPPDGNCASLQYPNSVPATRYYYVPMGQVQNINGINVYPDYAYYFCLGAPTGNFDPGVRILTPTGLR